MKIIIPALISLLFASSVFAETKYVTDDFEVMLRTGPSVQNKIVRPLRSGTKIEVLRLDSGNGHSQVQTSSGEIGYILTRFISDKRSARNRVSQLESQLEQLKSDPDELRALFANSQEQNELLIEQNVQLTNDVQKIRTELEKIKQLNGEELRLSTQNRKLETEVQQLLLQLDDIRIQNEALKDNSERVRNLVGVGILLIGLFLGWVLSKAGTRNRNSWGS